MLAEIFACRRRAIGLMVAIVATVAYLGLEARGVEVQVQLAAGVPNFIIVGLPDKAVGESRERVRAALAAIGLALPPKRITVNLSPADLPKEGSHFDLPIALGLLAALGATDKESLSHYVVVGELGLDGRIAPSPGVLLAAIHASATDRGLDLPGHPGAGGGVGRRCRSGRGSRPAGLARPFEGQRFASRADPRRGRGHRWRSGPRAGQGAGDGQASARNRRGGRA